ncbi:lipoprotein insertase outer membrane protein LolB [Zoogloea sp.]|uniref:lipoprotein insertase outer membrane protein LolB n=1 Tax=Zoogloea sp. TaxID=49181 RepID=UPI00262280B7|nr:lipoprotein insertase outer membrane protein LolB [Zoogloea sp.]MDD3354746.1 lipoprotein insertase outer membrane protein LolB [Zoogloea sp.]
MRATFAALAALALAACATPAPVAPPVPGAHLVRAALTHFSLEGRLQVRDGEQNAIVGVDWQHGPGRDEWLFTGPLGQGLARIEADAGGARLTLPDGQRRDASSAAELAESLLGVSAPLALLPLWVTARLQQGAEVREVDVLGRLARVVDQGWTIEYPAYATETPESLPRRVEVHRGDTRLRLIVDAWNP